MHTTNVTNFPSYSGGAPFACVDIQVSSEESGTGHINTTMSRKGRLEVTMFFNSPAEIRQFAIDLLTQASEASML